MVSKSSKSIPFVVLAIVILSLGFEAFTGTTVDIESYIPILVALGLGGASLEAIRSAARAKQAIPAEDFKRTIRTELNKYRR